MRFLEFQPYERLSDFLGLADLHALPQEANAADLVLPSKLGGMLASSKPIIAMTEPGTELVHFLRNTAESWSRLATRKALADAVLKAFYERKPRRRQGTASTRACPDISRSARASPNSSRRPSTDEQRKSGRLAHVGPSAPARHRCGRGSRKCRDASSRGSSQLEGSPKSRSAVSTTSTLRGRWSVSACSRRSGLAIRISSSRTSLASRRDKIPFLSVAPHGLHGLVEAAAHRAFGTRPA